MKRKELTRHIYRISIVFLCPSFILIQLFGAEHVTVMEREYGPWARTPPCKK